MPINIYSVVLYENPTLIARFQSSQSSEMIWILQFNTDFISKQKTKLDLKAKKTNWYFVTKIVLTYCEKQLF